MSVMVRSTWGPLPPRDVYQLVRTWLAQVMPRVATPQARCQCAFEETEESIMPPPAEYESIKSRGFDFDTSMGPAGPRLGPDSLWNQLYPSTPAAASTPPPAAVTVNAIGFGTDSLGTVGGFVDSIPMTP